MWGEVAGGGERAGDASKKFILGRGCDPVMAAQSASILPPLLGGCRICAFSDDDSFFKELEAMRKGEKAKPDVVFFAPGACRWSAARRPIPGGIAGLSHGWSLEQYYAHVRGALGEDITIVSTAAEAEMVPLLRKALGLS
jgi:hypothetical protein